MSITQRQEYQLFIDGQFIDADSTERITTINPATQEPIATVPDATVTDVDRAVDAAQHASKSWRATDPVDRGQTLHAIATEIRENLTALAELECRDQGKPLRQAHSDIESAATYFEYYAGIADKLEGKSIPLGGTDIDFTHREPYGVSGQIIPWNFPLSITARGVAPALATGNTVVIKPAPTTPLSALTFAELCKDAAVPPGAVNVVTGGRTAGAAVSAHDDIDQLTFTGSVPTGQAVMEAAAQSITPVTLELGGKNPAIVMPDADLDEAVHWITKGIFTNAGQVCSAADRALIHESMYDDVIDRIVNRAESLTLGPGLEDPDMGPLNHEAHFDSVLNYIDMGLSEGATLETGGEPLDRDGYFVEPTVFSDVTPRMQIAQEEIFGPVLTVLPFTDRDEAIQIANGTEFGLTGGVFSADIKQALGIAREIDAGSIYVNEWFGGSNATPFGGVKHSGIGREKGLEALDSYVQTKNIAVNLDDHPPA